MLPNAVILGCVVLGILATCAMVLLDQESVRAVKSLVSGEDELSSFRRVYLRVYMTAMMADWLQGPFVYALYESYGFSREANAVLFVFGFGSSALVGTFVGSLADRYGRRRFAYLYCLLYFVSCLTKHVNSFSVLIVGRLTGGVATSLLFSVFDAWLVAEHNMRGFQASELGATFSIAVFANSLVAITAGELGQAAADLLPLRPLAGSVMYGGYCAPFDLANCMLILCAVLLLSWSENRGDLHGSLRSKESLAEMAGRVVDAMRDDPAIAYCGLVCALFESSMFIFVFNWTPSLMEEGVEKPPFGHVFASFMIMCMLGSRLFVMLSQSRSADKIGLGTLLGALVCHFVPFTVENVTLRFFAFLGFEACVGLYFPFMGSLKGEVVPEELRSTIYNVFRVPLNIIVVLALMLKLSVRQSFFITTAMLCVAAWAQSRLLAMRADRLPRAMGQVSTIGKAEESEPDLDNLVVDLDELVAG